MNILDYSQLLELAQNIDWSKVSEDIKPFMVDVAVYRTKLTANLIQDAIIDGDVTFIIHMFFHCKYGELNNLYTELGLANKVRLRSLLLKHENEMKKFLSLLDLARDLVGVVGSSRDIEQIKLIESQHIDQYLKDSVTFEASNDHHAFIDWNEYLVFLKQDYMEINLKNPLISDKPLTFLYKNAA